MKGSDRSAADDQPALLARLQATMPASTGTRQKGERPAVPSTAPVRPIEDLPASPPIRPTRDPHPQTTFPAAKRDIVTPPTRSQERKGERNWLFLAFDAIRVHILMIASIATLAGFVGYVYTARICVPLYRIQASIEIRNNKSGAHAEALSRVLLSQTVVSAALAAMPEVERTALVEPLRLPFLGPADFDEALRRRLEAVTIPSAQVIDISMLSPNRPAAVDFVNGLIEALSHKTKEQRSASSALPDDWSGQQERAGDEVAIIDPAIPSVAPVWPNLAEQLSIAVACGTLLGVIIAITRRFAVNTFAGPGSVGQVLGVRELGAIPERKLLAPAGSMATHAGVQLDANDESLRYLRSSLLYQPGKQVVRFLAFTSAAPGEGKTTVVANLSMSLAATGRRVLVIDGDLRRPRLHKLMQVPSGPGLADLLRRDPAGPPASLSKFVHSTSFANLYVLPPGAAGNDAPELLARPQLVQLFRELARSFDFVLIDTPPLLACSDARNYARAVEGVVLVVRSSDTQKRAALVARDMLLQDGANIIGTVLTGWRQNYPAYNYPSASTYA